MTRTRVAIVGGGCGGAAAAFWLTQGDLREHYDVTLYSQGWRLGGKGASGRSLSPDHRIEEHGLHLWLGCYGRAFQLMRLCYAEQANPKPFATLADAFLPMPGFDVGGYDAQSDGLDGPPWRFRLPVCDAFPGGGDAGLLELVGERLSGLLRKRALGGRPPSTGPWRPRFNLRRSLTRFATLGAFALVFVKGLVCDVLTGPGSFEENLAVLEEIDFRDWLARHGAPHGVRESPLVRGIYDLAFAYPGGDAAGPGALAAGSTIGLILQMTGYRGAPLFRMASAMGDTIFAPLYRVLEARGVRVALFHRLKSVGADADDVSIDTLSLDRQADFAEGRYNPFIDVAGAECWPDQPLWDQLCDGDGLRERGVNFEDSADDTAVERLELRRGRDFDLVILATPPEVLKVTTRELPAQAWRRMLLESASVATQAVQLWFNETTDRLGASAGGLISAYAPAFSTWADMSHLLACETWTGPGAATSVHYLCGTLTDAEVAGRSPMAVVKSNLAAWLDWAAKPLWPRGEAASQVEYARANVDASERYVQAPPGGTKHRLAPDAAPYDNLYLAGDWTRTRYCGGCVENAVQSGLTAARAISRRLDLGGEGRRWT